MSAIVADEEEAGRGRLGRNEYRSENSRLENSDGVGILGLCKLLRENTDNVESTLDILLVGLPLSSSSATRIIETVSVSKEKSAKGSVQALVLQLRTAIVAPHANPPLPVVFPFETDRKDRFARRETKERSEEERTRESGVYSVSDATVTHLDAVFAGPSDSLEEVRVLTADVRFSRSRNLIESPVTCTDRGR